MNNATYIVALICIAVLVVPSCYYGMAYLVTDVAQVDTGMKTWQLAIVMFVVSWVLGGFRGSAEGKG